MTDALDAVLVLYHHFPAPNAPTILEHVSAFEKHSRFPVIALNTDDGCPPALRDVDFKAIVLHYSLFPGEQYFLDPGFLSFLDRSKTAHKIAFFQDDYRFCRQRFEFINRHGIDTVYTLLPNEFLDEVYGKYTNAQQIETTLTGYVSEEMLESSEQFATPDAERSIDVGYRARRVPFYLGRAGQEKTEIADRFLERVDTRDLRLDIATGEDSRIYGQDWYAFVASCRGMLGVEAGVSIFDFDDSARERTEALLAREPDLSYAEVERRVLFEYEGNIPYRVLSPRHLEAAAFRVVQILYEGSYSGVLEPDVHYLPLAKDFSNFDEVMKRFADPSVRHQLTEQAHADLIASGRYSYASFVAAFDSLLLARGLREHGVDPSQHAELMSRLERRSPLSRVVARSRYLRTRPFPGRRAATVLSRRVRRAVRKAR